MDTFSNTYLSAKDNYLKELEKEYVDWANRFHKRFNSWVIRLFGNETVCLNIWSKGWDRFMDTNCIRIDLKGDCGCIYICEEEETHYSCCANQRSLRDNECDWYECNPEFSADPIGNYETLIGLLKDKLSQYGEVPPQKR